MQIRSSRQHSLDIMWHFFYSGAVETVRCLTKFVWNLCRKAEPHVEGTGFLEAAFWTAGVLAVVQTPNATKNKKNMDLPCFDKFRSLHQEKRGPVAPCEYYA